jgi:hypothetical protein
VQCLALDRLVLDRRICHGINLAANRAGKRHPIFSALHVLPGKVPGGIAVALLSASLFAPCDLGSLSRPANCPDQNAIGTYPGGGHHLTYDSHLD